MLNHVTPSVPGTRPVALRPVPLVIHLPAEPCGSCESRRVSVCDSLHGDDLARLAAIAVPTRAAAGQLIQTEDTPAEWLLNIRDGTVRLFKSLPDGRRQIIGFAQSGHFLGLSPSGRNACSAEAIDAVEFCRFSRARMRTLVHDLPALEHRLMERVANELATAQGQMLLLGRKTAKERLATFLLERAEHEPCGRPAGIGAGPAAAIVHLQMPRQDIADYLGLTIETVSRTFTALRREGRIGLPAPSTVELLDRPGLEAIAAAD